MSKCSCTLSIFSCVQDFTHKTWSIGTGDPTLTNLLLHPFIQDAYQHPLTSGVMTTGQGGYTSFNRFASLMTNDNVSNDGTTVTIIGTE